MTSQGRLEALLDAFASQSLLVVGDVILDEYVMGDASRVSPEAPVPIVHVREESSVLGGAGNVVRNAIALGAPCRFSSVVGDDLDARRVFQLVKDLGVDDGGLVRDATRPTTRKTRVVARAQQMLRVDRELLDPVDDAVASQLGRAIEDALPHVGGVVFEDYGKGVLAGRVVADAMARIRRAGLPVFVDPKDEFAAYRGAQLFKPNLREAEAAAGMRVRDDGDFEELVRRLRGVTGEADLVITRGAAGMAISEGGSAGVRQVPTTSREVFDVQGAGDTIVAVTALARLAGATLFEAAVLANAAAGVVVGKAGTATASPEEVRERLPEAWAAAEDRA